jgi:hypothetical protein
VSEQLSDIEYRCPGENYAISRAVHLARLAGYYAACRDCPRREDTAGLSSRQVRRVTEAHKRLDVLPRSGAEGFRNVAINNMNPKSARAIAVEFARRLLDQCGVAQPAIVFASDGRLSTAAIVAAVVDGIRWTGCAVVDLGAASAPCAARAIEQLKADGGIYLGNPSGSTHTLGVKFWFGGDRVSDGPTLNGDWLEPTLLDRPGRAFGPLRRWNAAEEYLSELRPAYHALRPLRFVLRCTCEPVVAYLEDLLQSVACRVIPAEIGIDFGQQIVAGKAHFGIEITDDGETAALFDEQGRAVVAERLVRLMPRETDALRTLTHLLVLLSRDDMAFSLVLDRAGRER